MVSHTPSRVMMTATTGRSRTKINEIARIKITIGAQRMGTMASPACPLENMPPKMDLARGMISLAVMARPTPTIQPRPKELLMPEAVAASHRPEACPPMRMPKSPITAPRNQTKMVAGPIR